MKNMSSFLREWKLLFPPTPYPHTFRLGADEKKKWWLWSLGLHANFVFLATLKKEKCFCFQGDSQLLSLRNIIAAIRLGKHEKITCYYGREKVCRIDKRTDFLKDRTSLNLGPRWKLFKRASKYFMLVVNLSNVAISGRPLYTQQQRKIRNSESDARM